MNENSLKEEEKEKKLTYENNLWMYLDEIKERFLDNRHKLKCILKIFKQKNKLEENYSKVIKKLCDEYISKYPKNDTIKTQCDNALDKIIFLLKEESDLIEQNTKYVNSEIIKSFTGLIDTQINVSNEILKLMASSKEDFKLINQLLREKELNLMKVGKSLENSMYQLERALNIPDTQKDDENQENFELWNIKVEKEENKEAKNNINNQISREELIEKYKKEKEANTKKAKIIIFEYENFINIANDERKKYIQITSRIYNQFQKLDEDFISKFKNDMTKFLEKEMDFLKKCIELKDIYLKNNINSIDIQKDINEFINSKIIKFNFPTEIACLYYSPIIVLKNINDPIQSKITEKVNNELNSIFLKNKKKEEKKANNTTQFIKKCIKLILEEKTYEKDSLLKLLENSEQRKKFFEALNQYRIEGIFELQQKTFDEISFLFNYILKLSINAQDFDSLKSIIILSQTFFLSNKKDMFINSNINDNKIWKEIDFWEKIIDYSIKDELNNGKDFYIYLEEDSKSRKQRINSAIISGIITFIYNMKLLNFPEEKYKELIDRLISKYNIDGTAIYATVNSINNVIENQKDNNNQNNNNENNNNGNGNKKDNNVNNENLKEDVDNKNKE